MITIYGRANSVNVQAVMWCVGELGLDHERLDYGGPFGKTDTDAYRAIHPMGLVPALQDGDAIVWETPTILRYLMRVHGGHPAEPGAAATIESWADWSRSHLYPHVISVIFWQLIRTPASERDHGAIKRSTATADAALGVLVSRMTGPFIGGDKLNLADFAIGTLLHRYLVLDFDRNTPQAIADYYARLTERPAYREHVMHDPNLLKVEGA